MSKFDVVIKGGTVIDGLRTPRYKADVGIAGGRVVAIGRVDASDGREVVDASRQGGGARIRRPPHALRQPGVLGPVVHHVGLARRHQRRDRQLRVRFRARVGPRTVSAPCSRVSRNEAVPLKTMRVGMPWDWVTYPEFLDSVDRTPKGVNVMSFVPLAPLYAYVAGVDNAKAYRVTDEQLDEMCRLLVEGMAAGGCGFSAQVSGEVGNVQLDFDGTPMVTDCMTEQEVIAFSRAMGSLGRGTAQLTGTLETAALMARESGRPDHLERPVGRRRPQPARRSQVQPSRRSQAARLPERGGGPPRLRPSAHDQLRLRVHPRGLQPGRHDPVLAGGLPRHRRGEDGQVRRPGSPRRHEGDPRGARRPLRRRATTSPTSRSTGSRATSPAHRS